MARVEVRPGEAVRLEMPWSEVCMHLRVAGRETWVVLVEDGEFAMAQLLNDNHTPCSFPITTGEAGILGNPHDGFYVEV